LQQSKPCSFNAGEHIPLFLQVFASRQGFDASVRQFAPENPKGQIQDQFLPFD